MAGFGDFVGLHIILLISVSLRRDIPTVSPLNDSILLRLLATYAKLAYVETFRFTPKGQVASSLFLKMRDCGLYVEAEVPGENVGRTYKLHSKKIPGLNSHVTGAFCEEAALTTNKSCLSFYAPPP